MVEVLEKISSFSYMEGLITRYFKKYVIVKKYLHMFGEVVEL